VNLKIENINFKERYGFVRNGKGGKDRIFIIPEKLLRVLLQICVNRSKEEYLLLTNRNKKYNIRTIQKIVKTAAKAAKLNYRDVHCHTLRHSFATHLS